MKKLIIGATGFVVVVLGIYLIAANNGQNETGNVAPDNIKQMVQDLSLGKSDAKSAFITSSELTVVHADSKETTYALPKDEFFVSIAPFISATHPCATHYLISCQGEMTNVAFDVYIEDQDGNVILDEKVQSQSNGFIDLWLPRDKKLNVKISYDGKTVEQEISTFENDNTCITTMQLT